MYCEISVGDFFFHIFWPSQSLWTIDKRRIFDILFACLNRDRIFNQESKRQTGVETTLLGFSSSVPTTLANSKCTAARVPKWQDIFWSLMYFTKSTFSLTLQLFCLVVRLQKGHNLKNWRQTRQCSLKMDFYSHALGSTDAQAFMKNE